MGAHKRIVGDYTITTVGGNITANGNLITSNGIFWANGSAYSSGSGGGSYGNTQVAAYLTANPQPGTYSNTQVAAYLTANPQPGTYSNTTVSAYLPTYSGNLASPSVSGNLTVYGNLFVNGNTTTISTNTFIVNDNIIYMANANPANSLDIGFAGHFTSGTYQHTGLVRQASTGQWKLFSNIIPEPGNTLDFTNAVYDAIQVGNITSPTITDLYANAAVQLGQITGANTNISALQANIGSYYTWANANVAGLYSSIIGANANAASQQTQIATLQGQVYANTNVASYLPTYSGNIGATNVNSTSIYATNYLYPNGTSILSGIVGSGTYSNTNVAAYLSATTGGQGLANYTGNVNATFFTGNGYYLSGIASGSSTYGNANVSQFLTSIYGNANIGVYQPTFSTGNLTYGAVPITNLSSSIAVGSSPTLLDSFSTSSYRTAKYIISVTDLVNSEYQSSELLLVQNGTTANVTSYGLVYSNVSARMTFTANVSAGNVGLYGIGTSVSNTVKISKTLIPV